MIRAAVAADIPAIAAVHVAGWREIYTGLIGATAASSYTEADRARQWATRFAEPDRPSGLFVACEADGSVCGFVACGRARDPALGTEGEFHAIYLLRRTQGLGLGRGLMAAAAGEMRQRGMRSAGLWVLTANTHARGFYRHISGIEHGPPGTFRIGGIEVEEIAVVWGDLAALASDRTRISRS
jgi:ribosomal protein S18 acetylase RimI-like enzyme